MDINLRGRIMAAITAFRQPNIIQDLLSPEDFDDFQGRINRYQILWAFYENTAYNDMHSWARQYKLRFGLYRYIRNIFNPANRLGTFHQTHIHGGMLDPAAGDGEAIPSALPIITDNESLRPAIANIWEWSNWNTKKDLSTLYGVVMGDSFIRVVDSPLHKRVYLEVIHPKIVKELSKDDFGNVKGYVLEEQRPDPRQNANTNSTVTYKEIATRDDNNNVMFQTLLNGSLWPWAIDENGDPIAEWIVDYGFVPFVHGLHIDVGNQYGWSEMHAGRGKFGEIDDLASKLSDHIRKEVEGAWFFSGAQKPDVLKAAQGASSRDRPQPGREEKPLLYGGENATATSLISDLDINAVTEYIKTVAEEIERDYPELMLDESDENTAESGIARRVKQQPAATKIQARRMVYDAMIVHAQQMAITIGGMRGYEGFKGFDANSFSQGALDHSIGKRDVFANDELEDLQQTKLLWEAASIAKAAGMSLEQFMLMQGWTEKQVKDRIRQPERRVASLQVRQNARALQNAVAVQGDAIEIVDTTPPSEPEAGQ